MSQTVGIIGMGIMGQAMGHNVLKNGLGLTVYNRTSGPEASLVEAGAEKAATPAELTEKSDVIVVMLTGPEAIDALMFGDNGAADALKPGKTVINVSTVSPAYSRSLAERVEAQGADFVDAPVSGSQKPAQEGTLLFLAGGEEAVVKAAEPVLLTMGKKVIHCGAAGQGSMMKMSINLLLGAMMEGLAEMIHFGSKGGLSTEAMLDVVLSGQVSNPLFQFKEDMFKSGDFPAQFPLKHMAKDLKFVVDTAYDTGASAPAAHMLLQLFRKGVFKGLGDDDFAAVFNVLAEEQDQ